MRRPERNDGFLPIADYALIGDGRSAALVGLDGSIDWLCLPEVDSPPVFAALLDAERGGSFSLRPRGEFEAQRRYVDETNVLETVFSADGGTVCVTDAICLDGGALLPWTELVRSVECIEGEVALEWRVAARPCWGSAEAAVSKRQDTPLIEWGRECLLVVSHDAGKSKLDGSDVHGSCSLRQGEKALVALLYFDREPYAAPPRAELELRLERTKDYWLSYTREIPYHGPWLGAVRRSVLTQRLLTHAQSGAIAAAATTSLPERIGGERNWDYRYSWIRDTALALESLLAVRLTVECHRSFAWVMDASEHNHPALQPLYALDGSPDLPREDLDINGYRGSRPVRVGNDAVGQLQHGGYGDLLDAAYRYCDAGHLLDRSTGRRLAELADRVCEIWREDDCGIWELEPKPWTQSKLVCWLALDHAVELAEDDHIPAENVKHWRGVRDEIRAWVDENCWSAERQAYVRACGSEDLDASILLAARFRFVDAADDRYLSTLAALRAELGDGPFLYRFTGARDEEGCFLACSFWLVDGLARAGRVDEARALMEELLQAGNDVGLYSEEIDPGTGDFLGNFPQALTHLSLILAAVSVMRAERARLGT